MGGSDTQAARPRSREKQEPRSRSRVSDAGRPPERVPAALYLQTSGPQSSAPCRPPPHPRLFPSPFWVRSTLLHGSRRCTRKPGAGRRAPTWPAQAAPCLPPPPLAAQAVIMTSSLFLLPSLASEPRTATAAAGGGLVTASCAG